MFLEKTKVRFFTHIDSSMRKNQFAMRKKVRDLKVIKVERLEFRVERIR